MHQHTFRALLAAVLAVCLVGLAAGGTLAQDDTPSPEMEVVYDDEFRTDDTVVENANTTGSAQVIKQNTRATIEDDDAFVRVGLENPNSYAVAFEVQLSENRQTGDARHRPRHRHRRRDGRLAGPTRLRGRRDTHARHRRRPGRDGRALHAEPTARQVALVDRRRRTVGRDAPRARDEALGRRPSRTAHVRGDRQRGRNRHRRSGNPETGDRIEEWHATYTLAGDEAARPTPLAEGTGEPVFYRPIENDDGTVDAIQVTFNEAGTVSLTVEPTTTEKLGFEMTSYRSSVLDGFEWGPFASTARVTP